jgi:hypothetical protein
VQIASIDFLSNPFRNEDNKIISREITEQNLQENLLKKYPNSDYSRLESKINQIRNSIDSIISKYYPKINELEKNFYKNNPSEIQQDSSFINEGNKLKS